MAKMKVDDYLLHHTDVGDLIQFTYGGWRIGMTYIDHEDLFIQSLNERLLNATVVSVDTDRKLYVGSHRNPTEVAVTRSIEIKY